MPSDLASYVGAAGLIQKTDQETVDAMTKSGDWLPRVAVMTSTSKLITEGKPGVAVGDVVMIVSDSQYKVLGKETEMLFIAFHPRAMDVNVSPPLSYYNRESVEFKNIVAKSEAPNSGCMFGLEFLCWLPSENQFVLFFCSSKTARRETPAILALMNKDKGHNEFGPAPIRVRSRLVKNERNSWWSFSALEMSTPLPDASEVFSTKIQEVLTDFNNPEDSKAPEPAGAPARDR